MARGIGFAPATERKTLAKVEKVSITDEKCRRRSDTTFPGVVLLTFDHPATEPIRPSTRRGTR